MILSLWAKAHSSYLIPALKGRAIQIESNVESYFYELHHPFRVVTIIFYFPWALAQIVGGLKPIHLSHLSLL
jgi:hypothetical protein